MTEDEKFQKLVDEYLESSWKQSPISATFSGIHKYDDQVQSFTLQSALERHEHNRNFAKRFQSEIDASKLNESNRIDLLLILTSVKEEEFRLKQSRNMERDPSIYPRIISGIAFLMFSREYAPLEERMASLAKRMEKLPQVLEDGRKNLAGADPPEIWTQIAIQTTTGAIGLYQNVIAGAAKQLPDGNTRNALEAAMPKMVSALQAYLDYLNKDLLPRSKGNFNDGRENFVYRLRNFYMLNQTPEEIKAVAQKVLADTKIQMDAIAAKTDPKKKWWEILEEAKKKHFTAEEVLPQYRKVTERARNWVIEKNLASIPEEDLDVIETPQFMRFVIPYAAYFSPAPFEKEQKGFYFVTPVDEGMSQKEKEGKLGELTIDIENTTVHEAYPGHHLQFIHQNQLSKIRRLSGSSLMSEGWGLYCERLGEEFGFYSTPVDRLQAYRWLLVRAVRVLIDVGLHVDGMDYSSAVDLMVEHTKIEKPAAEAEVRRYTQSPTQPLSYLMGMLMIQDLREEMKAAEGDKFSLKAFHDRVMGYGAIPVSIIRDSMRGK